MAAATSKDELSRISEGLSTIVNWEIGQEDEVRTNRQANDIPIILCEINDGWKYVRSGSRAEGFEFTSSDIDFMFINENVLVIDSKLRNVWNTTLFPVVLLMETDNSPPGFTLLKSISHDRRIRNDDIGNTLLQRGDSVYMSSERAQQIALTERQTSLHGPCRSGTAYVKEFDFAYTLKCPFWPRQAHSVIHRSISNGWPTTDELRNICKDGILLVPISGKHRTISDNEDLEWRISFSLAEKKLVYSMNHCQFLCYGLMKIFLNEVLKELPETKTETGNVLCSYFMKTAVFWEISECLNQWSDKNFLNKFLNVFRRVIKWTEDGYCPNFFKPEHNMFYGKIYGRRQRGLTLRLRSLYDGGILCLYRCSLIRGILSIMLNNRLLFDLVQTLKEYDLSFQKEIVAIQVLTSAQYATYVNYDISTLKKELCFTASLISDSAEIVSAIKLKINQHLHMLAIIFAKRGFQKILRCKQGYGHYPYLSCQNLTPNKLQYLFTKRAKSILRKTKTAHCLSTIHQAVISYMNGEYHKTIKIVHHIQQRLQDQPYNYEWDVNGAFIMGCRQQDMSYENIFKTFIITAYDYDPVISIPELTLESIVQKRAVIFPFIPPLVFLYFLVILSYTRLNKPVERKEALGELHSILYHDNNHHIEIKFKPISWEILGIVIYVSSSVVTMSVLINLTSML